MASKRFTHSSLGCDGADAASWFTSSVFKTLPATSKCVPSPLPSWRQTFLTLPQGSSVSQCAFPMAWLSPERLTVGNVHALANVQLTWFTTNGSTFFQNPNAHHSTYSNIHPPTPHHTTPRNPTQHNTEHTPHHTDATDTRLFLSTSSAPATPANISETQHHCPQQEQTHFIQSGTRSEVYLDDLPDASDSTNKNLAKAHEQWHLLRCRCVAGALPLRFVAGWC